MKLKIINAYWTDPIERNIVSLTVGRYDDGGNLVEEFPYTANDSDPAETNVILWEMFARDTSVAAEPEIFRILRGHPPPHGKRLVDGKLMCDVERLRESQEQVTRELDRLHSGSQVARAERSLEFTEARRKRIDGLLLIEDRLRADDADFAWGVDFSRLDQPAYLDHVSRKFEPRKG